MNEGAPSDNESQAAMTQAERENGRSDADGQALARIEHQLREVKVILLEVKMLLVILAGFVVLGVLFLIPAVLGVLVWTWWREGPKWRAWLGRRRRTR